jgi:ATP-dependent DNA ligase
MTKRNSRAKKQLPVPSSEGNLTHKVTRSSCPTFAIPLYPEAMSAFRFIQTCSPNRAKEAPTGNGWLHEVKFDGYCVQSHKVGARVMIYNRNGHDFTERFPSVVWSVLSAA